MTRMTKTRPTMVFDLDGTICFDGRSIHTDIVREIRSAKDDGWSVVVASARPLRDQDAILGRSLPIDARVGANGALFRRGESEGALGAFTPRLRHALRTILDEHECRVLADDMNCFFYDGAREHTIASGLDLDGTARVHSWDDLQDVVKVLVVGGNDLTDIAHRVRALGCPLHVHDADGTIDIAPPGVDKARALERLGIDEYVAFGNDDNDVNMLEAAALAYRVGPRPDLRRPDVRNLAACPASVAHAIKELRLSRHVIER